MKRALWCTLELWHNLFIHSSVHQSSNDSHCIVVFTDVKMKFSLLVHCFSSPIDFLLNSVFILSQFFIPEYGKVEELRINTKSGGGKLPVSILLFVLGTVMHYHVLLLSGLFIICS